jgi:hypothetical protein
MAVKKMTSDGRGPWKNRLLGILAEQIQRAFVTGVRKGLMRLLRIIILALAGVIVLAAGIIFLWIGFYYFLSKFLQPWIAWLIVGFASTLLGLFLLLAAYLTR